MRKKSLRTTKTPILGLAATKELKKRVLSTLVSVYGVMALFTVFAFATYGVYLSLSELGGDSFLNGVFFGFFVAVSFGVFIRYAMEIIK